MGGSCVSNRDGMAERYAQHRTDERAVTAHRQIGPLDRI
jgi:hypothetical protein